MVNARMLEQLQQRISELLRSTPAKDIEASMKTMLTGFFERMDLVTREEFDIQREVLRRTREQLEQLEARVRELQSAAPSKPDLAD
ncbi:MAG TPA: accessory factor UbiK family protein [Burkholderiales bacterium]|nr:accessory factor UbiK family protein [Burkholderiales bacterium]